MTERRTTRVAPAARGEGNSEEPRSSAVSRKPVRTAQRPVATPALGERVARAWSRHPLVAMARHRRRLTFYVGLHSMLRAGVPLITAFRDLSRGAGKDAFRQAVAEVGKAVAGGSSLTEAMRRHPVWFDPEAVAAVEAGEASGTLESALSGIISRMEEMQSLRWRTFWICLYPVYLLVAFIVGGSILDGATGAVSAGNTDTLASGIITAVVSRFFSAGLLGLGLFLSPLAVAALGLERVWERIRLRLPLLGGFHRRVQASRFCGVLGTSLGAGLDAARSLRMAIEATGNRELEAKVGAAVQRLQDGATFADVVEWLGVLDGESLRQVAIGESSGRIEPLLQQQARENSEAALRGLRTLILVLVVAAVVYLLATSIARVFTFQMNYFQRIDELSQGK